MSDTPPTPHAPDDNLRFKPYTAKAAWPWQDLAADRATCPVAYSAELDAVQVTSYSGVKEALLRHDALSSTYSDLWPLDEPLPEHKQVLGASDPPRHTRQRRLLVKALSASRIQHMRPFSERLADDLVDEIIATGPVFDLVTAYARRMSEGHVAELLGIPSGERDAFARMAQLFEASIEDRANHGFSAELNDWITHLTELVRSRRAGEDTGDDLITQLCLAEVEGDRFDEKEIAALIQLLAGAGISTTQQAIVNLVYLLDTHPQQRTAYLADINGLTTSLVNEGLRFDGPVLGLWRRCLKPTTVQGTRINVLDKVFPVVAAANHDPEAYDRPDEFVIDRDWSALPPHLSFGHGIHYCVGMNLALLELQVAISTLYRRLPGLRTVKGCEPRQMPGPVVRSWPTLSMEYDSPAGVRNT
ncbi:cytochrome P450 hydroxylase [Streptomyces olivaceoviridis]|uniref:cytochrome P450 n=1 Tax=Streptomyces olivaceoviridis TaxID=1921 RepID=UPI00167B6AE4|nr:cytochrome P450 [Streptomyces olivaceoviridis]GGZ15094.1 cytochrome P450 hydroxylase [Streptomyces olivaceoviridis]